MHDKIRRKLVIGVLVIVFFSFLVALYGLNVNELVETREIEMSLIVENSRVMGFNVDNEILTFGKVPRGVSGMRLITIENNYDFPVTVSLKKKGEISEFISFSDNNFILDIGESKDVGVIATPPYGAIDKTYAGVLRIFFVK